MTLPRKILVVLPGIALLVTACRKNNLSENDAVTAKTVASDALLPMPCHSTSFVTDYPIKPGEVPPFRFTKTLYSDTRVKTINMLSRVNSKHWMLQQQAYELNGTFTYSINMAHFTGTRETWEYYQTESGAAGKKLVARIPISYSFRFDSGGHCVWVGTNGQTSLEISYDYYSTPKAIQGIAVYATKGDTYKLYEAVRDSLGNVLTYRLPFPDDKYSSNVIYSYDYKQPANGKTFNYTPSQNLISQEFSILEAMQWVPSGATHVRKTVSGVFFPQAILGTPSNYRIVQTQTYKNHKFDSKGNLVSYTYADNVLQKTTWYCK
jgi:hypothetical protein